MTVEVKVPRLAESISEAVLVQWLKQDGEQVKTDEPIATLETDKAAVELPADVGGVLHHEKKVGDTVTVGDVIARIDESAGGGEAKADGAKVDGGAKKPAPVPTMKPAPVPMMKPAPAPAMKPTPAPTMKPATASAPAMKPAPVP